MVKKILWTILILATLGILSLKFAYGYRHMRFIAFGMDTNRVMSYVQHLRVFHTMPHLINRPGLPIFAYGLHLITGSSPVHVMDLPYFLIYFGSYGLLYGLIYLVTKSHISSAVAGLFFAATTFIMLTDSIFVTFVLFPLILVNLLLFHQQPHPKKYWYILFFFLSLCLNLTHMIAALMVNCAIFGIVWLEHLKTKTGGLRIAFPLFAQVASYIVMYLYVVWENLLPITAIGTFINRLYGLDVIGYSGSQFVGLVILGFLLVQLISGLLILRNWQPPKINLPLSIYFIRIIAISLTILGLGSFFGIIPISLPYHPLVLISGAFTLLALIGNNRLPRIAGHIGMVVIAFLVIYLLSPLTPVDRIVQNERVTRIPLYLSLVPIGWLLAHKRSLVIWPIVLLTLFTGFKISWASYLDSYAAVSGQTPLIKATAWLEKQPDFQNTVFFAEYFRKNLQLGERHHSLSLTSSRIPWSDQDRLNLCLKTDLDSCEGLYLDYIRDHDVKYLVIETWPGNYPLADELATASGKIVYDDLVRIVQYD